MNTLSRKSVWRFWVLLPVAALAIFGLAAHAAEDFRVGTYKLVKRQLPDGTMLSAPAVGGIATSLPDGTVHYSVFWQTPEGKPASVASINVYKYSETELAATRLFGVFDDGSGKAPVYSAPGTVKNVPLKREGGKLSYQHPFDAPFIVIDGDNFTATLDGVFVDYWELAK